MMNRFTNLVAVLIAVLVLSGWTGLTVGAEFQTVVGVLNEDDQIVADDGEVYEVADTQAGNEMLLNVDTRVEVKGLVMESKGFRMIEVESYRLLKP